MTELKKMTTPHATVNVDAPSKMYFIPTRTVSTARNGMIFTAIVTAKEGLYMEDLIFLHTAAFSSIFNNRFPANSPMQSHA